MAPNPLTYTVTLIHLREHAHGDCRRCAMAHAIRDDHPYLSDVAVDYDYGGESATIEAVYEGERVVWVLSPEAAQWLWTIDQHGPDAVPVGTFSADLVEE